MKRSENLILVMSMVVFSFAAWGNAPINMQIEHNKRTGDDLVIKAVANDVKVNAVNVNDGKCGELHFEGMRAVVGDASAKRPVMNYGDERRITLVQEGRVVNPCRVYKVELQTSQGAYVYTADDYVDQHAQAANNAVEAEDEPHPPSTYNDAAAAATERPTGAVAVKYTADGIDVVALKDVVINGVVAASPDCAPVGGDKHGIKMSAGKTLHYSLVNTAGQVCTVDIVSVITNYGMEDYNK